MCHFNGGTSFVMVIETIGMMHLFLPLSYSSAHDKTIFTGINCQYDNKLLDRGTLPLICFDLRLSISIPNGLSHLHSLQVSSMSDYGRSCLCIPSTESYHIEEAIHNKGHNYQHDIKRALK